MVKLYTDRDITSVSHKGKQYDLVDGEIDVADDDVAALVSEFGFISVPVPVKEMPKRGGKKSKQDEEPLETQPETEIEPETPAEAPVDGE